MLTSSNSIFVSVLCFTYVLWLSRRAWSILATVSTVIIPVLRCLGDASSARRHGKECVALTAGNRTNEERNPAFLDVGCEMTIFRWPSATNNTFCDHSVWCLVANGTTLRCQGDALVVTGVGVVGMDLFFAGRCSGHTMFFIPSPSTCGLLLVQSIVGMWVWLLAFREWFLFFLPWEVCMSNAARLVKPSWAALNVACGKCREFIVQEVSNVMVVSLYAFLAASCSEEILYCLLWGLWQVFVIKLFTEEGCCRCSYCVMLVRNG